ncbi:amylo-alpha-1,6-glucosidase [Oceanispirochaeta crateris]|uniref:beta-fructofuranosidase n=1 Tax=Oceanispirochaeta crateris TaxID=2518645 RepID=A0A5C1QP49_9SPIO|nr:glycoside hydrolase 100 family protein [Oceanispirochaeta crateris]QEN08770.1 amylo-alpha-1,6-glucosidase [Oceanispirochaeta crateris]
MDKYQWDMIHKAELAAHEVLRHNAFGPFENLPRTAGWGYPEPYTRDLMIAMPGMLLCDDPILTDQMRMTLQTLASNQSPHGQIPSLVHDSKNRGASDTTPLYLLGLALFRAATGEKEFLEESARQALNWMTYQSPTDSALIGQLPTTDWRDEQWVIGYGLYVNTLAYAYLRFFGEKNQAAGLAQSFCCFDIKEGRAHSHVHSKLREKEKPYYGFWSFKVYSSERFDLLGNSLAILTGLAPLKRAKNIVKWISRECEFLKTNGDLIVDLPPNFFPYMRKEDPDWLDRYEQYNRPGEYHNGGIWPFINGFYIAALVAAEEYDLAEEKLMVLTELVQKSGNKDLTFGFNEWIKAQDGSIQGQDWQTWSAAMYIYAARCVRDRKTPFFDIIRQREVSPPNSSK